MAKNIVICCDGTNNDPEHDETNVARLYRVLEKGEQVVYYDPGVGTFAQPGLVSPIAKGLSMALGLAFGAGFTHNLEQAYSFLVRHYEPGDRLFFFGFSRGAFTVHALAGMVHMCGILRPAHENLIPYASRIYKGAGFASAQRLRDTYSWEFADDEQPIHYLGVWDTVSSVGFFLKRHTMPYTTKNPRIRKIRHALAINERRAYFRPERWRVSKNQDVKEVWFPGVHSDIGGGYPTKDAELAHISLAWMIQEAVPGFSPGCGYPRGQGADDLLIDDGQFEAVLLAGRNRSPAGKYLFDPVGALRHRSLKGPWWTLEGLPKNHEIKRSEFALPRASRREIEPGDTIHVSALERAELTSYELRFKADQLNLSPEDWPAWAESEPPPADRVAEKVVRPSFSQILVTPILVIGFSYIFWTLLLSAGNLWLALGRLASQIGQSGPLHVWSTMEGAFFEVWSWPYRVFSDVGHAWESRSLPFADQWQSMVHFMLLFLVPPLVIVLGGWCIDRASGFWEFRKRIRETILHKRFFGYDAHNIANQFFQLERHSAGGDSPLDLYRRSLAIDRFFPVLYVPITLLCLHMADQRFHWWILALPLVAGIADFIENWKLIQLTDIYKEICARIEGRRRYSEIIDSLGVHGRAIGLANLATRLKISSLVLAFTILASKAGVFLQAIVLTLLSGLILWLGVLGAQVFVQALRQGR